MIRKALITGISGQDGSYLAELLLEKGYAIESPEDKLWRLRTFLSDLDLHVCSLDNPERISGILRKIKPRECYHLAGHSFVSYSFEDDFA